MTTRKRTDTYAMTFTIRDRNGAAVNTTGYTVTINIVNKATRVAKVVNGACVAVNAALGQWKYTPVAGDVDTSDAYDREVKAVAPDSTLYHVPTKGYDGLYIQDNLG